MENMRYIWKKCDMIWENRVISEEKNSFYGLVGFLTCFTVDLWKPFTKIRQTHFLTAFWSWHSWKLSKMKVFSFLNFLETFVLIKFAFHSRVGFLTCFSVDPGKTAVKIPKTHLSTAFRSLHWWEGGERGGNFQKLKFLVFSIFSKFCFPIYDPVFQIVSHTQKLLGKF